MEMGAADIAAATNHGYGDGFGCGGSGIWLFAILALMWGGFGGNRWNNGNDRCATVEDLANQSNFTRLEGQVLANGQAIQQSATNLGNGICNLGYQIAKDNGALSKEISDCCCQNERMTLENRYLAAQNSANTNAVIVSQVQSIKDMLAADKAAAQAARIQQLELQQALCGVIRYPNSVTYSAGSPCGCFNNC